MKCPDCGKKLTPLYPSPEEYLNPLFCINVFSYKLMIFKEHIEYGCVDCLIDKQQSIEREKARQIMEDYRLNTKYEED
jgi:hypothetical protein